MNVIILYYNIASQQECTLKITAFLNLLLKKKNILLHLYLNDDQDIISDLHHKDNLKLYPDFNSLLKVCGSADLCFFNSPKSERWVLKNITKSGVQCNYICFDPVFLYQLTTYRNIKKIIYFEEKQELLIAENIRRRCFYVNLYPFIKKAFVELNQGSPARVVYFHSETDQYLTLVRKLCSYFNLAIKTKFTIVADKAVIAILKNEVNDNITFINRNKNIIIKADVVIADNFIAKYCIYHGIPVLVTGMNGLGGLITRQNFNLQLANGCKGRIGGNFMEYVPREILQYEVGFALSKSDQVKNDAKEISSILFKANTEKKEINAILTEILSVKLLKYIFLEDDIELVPSDTYPSHFFLQGKNGLLITLFEKKYLLFFKLLKKGLNTKDLNKLTGYPVEEQQLLISALQKFGAIYYNEK